MTARKPRPDRDVEKDCPREQFVAKLRRLADAIERGRRFRLQVAGERISLPPDAAITIEHERGAVEEELEFQLKWKHGGKSHGQETMRDAKRTKKAPPPGKAK